MSWAPEVIADSSGKWCGNELRFAPRTKADSNVCDLAMRWTLVVDFPIGRVHGPGQRPDRSRAPERN